MTMIPSRRSFLSALGVMLPFAPAARAGASGTPAPALRFRSFEDAVREAFRDRGATPATGAAGPGATPVCRRIEVGHSDLIDAGVQGCHNDRPFAGFPAGCLRIVRSGSEPGPVRHGARLYVATVDVVLTGGQTGILPTRPLDFASLPAAPILCDKQADQGELSAAADEPTGMLPGVRVERPFRSRSDRVCRQPG